MEVRVLYAVETNVFLAHCRTVKQKKILNIEKSTYTTKFYLKKKNRNCLKASLFIKDEESKTQLHVFNMNIFMTIKDE